MKYELTRSLRKLGRLKVSSSLKASVLASVVTAQAAQIRSYEKSIAGRPRISQGTCGRQLQDLEPAGFSALPDHARPMVERYYRFGGESNEYETASA